MIQYSGPGCRSCFGFQPELLVLPALLAAAALRRGLRQHAVPLAVAGAARPHSASSRATPTLRSAAPSRTSRCGLVGARYRYGGTDPVEGFDCSGLVYYAYDQAGYRVPRTLAELFRAARKIALGDAGAGDLMFFQDQAEALARRHLLGRRAVRARTRERPATSAVASLDARSTTNSTSSPSAGCLPPSLDQLRCALRVRAPQRCLRGPSRLARTAARVRAALELLPHAETAARRDAPSQARSAPAHASSKRCSAAASSPAPAPRRRVSSANASSLGDAVLLAKHSLDVGAKLARTSDESAFAVRRGDRRAAGEEPRQRAHRASERKARIDRAVTLGGGRGMLFDHRKLAQRPSGAGAGPVYGRSAAPRRAVR